MRARLGEGVGLFFLTGVQRIILYCADGPKKKVEIQFGTGLTYSHVSKITSALAEAGCLRQVRVGRATMVSLTDDGRKKAKALLEYVGGVK